MILFIQTQDVAYENPDSSLSKGDGADVKTINMYLDEDQLKKYLDVVIREVKKGERSPGL